MPKFVTVGYGDRAGYERTPEQIRRAAHEHDAQLQRGGALMGIAGSPVQVRNPENAGVQRSAGPYARSELPVAGFAVIEAPSLAQAIELVSRSPCAVAHGVVEIWPLVERTEGGESD